MGSPSATGLLAADDPPPVGIINPAGTSAFLLLGDHAGISIPPGLGRLGLGDADLARHIASDIGVRALGAELAARLDAVFIHQRYSRLVVDCNRDSSSPEAIVEIADGTPVPGNLAIGRAAAAERIADIHRPYHDAIAAEIGGRREQPILIAVHSFTPRFDDHDRPWDIGVLHDGGETSFALRLLDILKQESFLVVGDNEPYRMDATDYTVPLHAYAAGLPYAELEIRQDLIENVDGQQRWAELLARWLRSAAVVPAG